MIFLDLNDNCQIRDKDAFLAEIEEIVRLIQKPGFCAESKRPIKMARAALNRSLREKTKNDPIQANLSENKAYDKTGSQNESSNGLYEAVSWLMWNQKGHKGKGGKQNWEWNGKNKGGKQEWDGGKGKVKFDNIAWLRKLERYQAVNAQGEQVELKTLIFCRWLESRNGCRQNLANGAQCLFCHDKATSFVVRQGHNVDTAFDVFTRWAATRGYTVTERPEAANGQKGAKGGKGAAKGGKV